MCYNKFKPCCAGWVGFLITLLHYPLFAYFPHTQDSQHSIPEIADRTNTVNIPVSLRAPKGAR
jgi:hypothetical protein